MPSREDEAFKQARQMGRERGLAWEVVLAAAATADFGIRHREIEIATEEVLQKANREGATDSRGIKGDGLKECL